MDFLASLHIQDLPEQQTRMMELMERHPELDVKLGFDACCTCAAPLLTTTKVSCPHCRRVDYCSEACREQDARALQQHTMSNSNSNSNSNDDDDNDHHEHGQPRQESAAGHSSIICALLKLCQDDEDVENGDQEACPRLDAQRREAAQDRIRSELESYPATLANVIAKGPCYQSVWQTKSDKLVIHIVGATAEAELWDKKTSNSSNSNSNSNNEADSFADEVSAAYAEALGELADQHANLTWIELYFVGPDCPQNNLQTSRPIPMLDRPLSTELILKTYRGLYNTQLLQTHHIPKADIVVFFNPGFTVPDYPWVDTLSCIPRKTPFLSTTNTEMEGIADCQFLLDQDRIQTIPLGLAEMFGLYSSPDDGWHGDHQAMAMHETSFFTVNPFCGMRVRQSGTMANDLFVKNRWMLGGILDSFDPSVTQQKHVEASVNKKRAKTSGASTSSSTKALGSGGNTKARNPALI